MEGIYIDEAFISFSCVVPIETNKFSFPLLKSLMLRVHYDDITLEAEYKINTQMTKGRATVPSSTCSRYRKITTL